MRGLILAPPRVDIDANLAWLLRAAFADSAVDPGPPPAKHVLHLVRETQLSGRVAKRLEAWRRTSQAGALGQEFDADYFSNIATEALLAQALERVAGIAARFGVPVVAAKYAGLRLAGVITSGTRAVCDLDLLVPKAAARGLWRALLDAGFLRTHSQEYAHQLEALVDPYGATIDLHIHLPGVVVEKGGFATAEQLIARGLITRSLSSPNSLLVPNSAVLAAHAIVHALQQNLATPQTHSPLRMVADLMDLRRSEPDVVSLASKYLAPELKETCDTLERLCASLAKGVFSGGAFDGTPEQALLWHCLAARLDFDYSERLRAAGLTNKLRDGSSALEIARYVAQLLYPGERELEVLYGPAAGPVARVRRRLHRPVDLTVRAFRRWVRSR